MHQSPQTSVHEIPDMLQDLFGPMDQSLASAFPDTDNMFDPDLSSPISFSTDMSDFDIFGAADYLSAGMENSSSNISGGLFDAFPMVEDSVSKHLAISFPDSTPGAMTSLSKEVQECQEVRATATPCSCLVQALGLMKHTEEKSITRATQDVSNVSGTPSIQAAIAQNEATIEAISKMLECSYLQDGYLLAVASLIIFKVLGCYAAVARTMPSLQGPQAGRLRSPSSSEQTLQSPAIVGNHRHESEDSARITAQLILNELHRVRRLIDQLSVKLKMRAAQQGRVEGGEMPGSLDMDCEMTLPPVAVMYEQVDVDLRKQLKELSRKIIGRLRKL
ncbi:hypothetical protein MMC19_000980 [Ptychographa xylographoides]|nr:hypothetical protein [Ptychographa xylographoides]